MEENKKYDEVVLSKIRKDPVAFDLQISLFMSALKNYRHDSLLRPFPSSFIKENQEKDVNELVSFVRTKKYAITCYVYTLL